MGSSVGLANELRLQIHGRRHVEQFENPRLHQDVDFDLVVVVPGRVVGHASVEAVVAVLNAVYEELSQIRLDVEPIGSGKVLVGGVLDPSVERRGFAAGRTGNGGGFSLDYRYVGYWVDFRGHLHFNL